MKSASLTILALVLLPSGIVAACASGSDTELFDNAGGASAAATTSVSSSSGKVDPGPVCVPSCTTDLDCQNSCPPAGAASNCCDTAAGMCFVSNTASCPAPMPDGGADSGMPPY